MTGPAGEGPEEGRFGRREAGSSLRTGLGVATEDRISLAGFDLADELMGGIDLGDLAFLVVAKRLPSAEESRLFNAVLVALCDHGLTPAAITARLTWLGAPGNVQGAIAAGLLGAGSRFLGTVEDTARLLQDRLAPEGRAGGAPVGPGAAADSGPGAADSGPGAADSGPGAAADSGPGAADSGPAADDSGDAPDDSGDAPAIAPVGAGAAADSGPGAADSGDAPEGSADAPDRETLAAIAREVVADADARGERLPGLGHPLHKRGDPRTARLYELAKETGLLGPHLRLLDAIAGEAWRTLGKALPVNGAGAGGAALSDLGFHWSVVRGFAVAARAVGLVGHLWEEQQAPMGQDIWDLADGAAAHDTSSRDQGHDPPPRDAGQDPPPPDAGHEPPPRDAGNDPPPRDAAHDTSSRDAGHDTSSRDAGDDPPPRDEGRDADD